MSKHFEIVNENMTKPPFDAKWYLSWYIQHCKTLGDMLGIEIVANDNGDVCAMYQGQKLMFAQVKTSHLSTGLFLNKEG